MSILSQITTGKQKKPLKTLIYGPEGVGKSTFCALPGSVWLCAENGTNHLNVARLPANPSWQQCAEYVTALETEPHDYWALVIDSADWLEHIAADFISQRERKDFGAIPYGKGPAMLADEMIKFLKAVDHLSTVRNMDIYIIAHAQITEFSDPNGDAYSRWTPALNKKCVGPFKEWADNVLFFQFDEYTSKAGQGFKERAVGKGSGRRVMLTEHRPAHDAKNRFNLPYKLPLDANAHTAYRQLIDNFYL